MIKDGEPYSVEFQICRNEDKRILWVHSIAEYDAEQKTVFGVIHDITLRKEKEAALQKYEQEYKSLFTEMMDRRERICS